MSSLNTLNPNTPGGYLIIDESAVLGGKGVREWDTFTCSHCQGVVLKNPDRKRTRYHCRGCDHLLCDNCAAIKVQTGVCRTMKQIFDETQEAAERSIT